jgi:hypothetical protein
MCAKALSGSAVISLTLLSTVLAAQVAPAVSRTAGPPTAEITGKVIDTDGGTLPGAYVYARSLSPQSPIREAVSVVEADGSFRLGNLTPGTYWVKAELIGFRSASLTRAVAAAGVRDLALVLPIGSISGCSNLDPLPDGSILDVQGKPIVAAVVVVDSETRGTELHFPYQQGQFSPGCFQPRPEDEVRVVVGSFGSRVIKPKGVDPATVSWRIVIDVDKMTVVR